MPSLTFARIAKMVDGRVVQGGDILTHSVVIDSREVKDDSVFFAIRGDRLDGHDFLASALETAAGAVVSTLPAELPEGKGIVQVADTTAALKALARAIRHEFPFLLIAITGSAGKTTTKEMIAALVATERRTFKSWGNFNNLIGNPLCVDNTPDDVEVVVSEMGMNHKGEIAAMASNLQPDVGVYTNIGPVHIEFFGTVEKIALAKRELLENVKPGGTVVVNVDNEHVVRISSDYDGPKVTYGIEHDAQYRGRDVQDRGLLGSRATLEAEGTTRTIELALPGTHNLENLLAAIATARSIGISWEGIERGIAEIKPAYHRGVVVPWHGATIYDDTYNSNPYALGRALELMTKADVTGRRIAVVGDMLELGENELTFHFDSGKAIPKSVDVVLGVGKRTQALLDGARDAGFDADVLHHFDDAEAAADFLRDFIREGDLVLIKGSRGVGLDRIIARLQETEAR